jgi:hypothetical protein
LPLPTTHHCVTDSCASPQFWQLSHAKLVPSAVR